MDIWQHTRWGMVPMDPDDAPTPDEQFAERLELVWENATGVERMMIARERGKLGIKDKSARDLTETELAVFTRTLDAESNAYHDQQADEYTAEQQSETEYTAEEREADELVWQWHTRETEDDLPF